MSAATFEDYRREHGIADDHPNLDGWRALWQHELQIEQHRPTVIPPCPSWCVLPAGHDYPSVDVSGDELTFERDHLAFEGKVGDVQATEHNRAGRVTVDVPVIYLDVRSDLACPAYVARALAAELLEAADVLERLRQ